VARGVVVNSTRIPTPRVLDTRRTYPRTLEQAWPLRHDTGLSGPYVQPGVMAALLRAVRRLLESKGPQ